MRIQVAAAQNKEIPVLGIRHTEAVSQFIANLTGNTSDEPKRRAEIINAVADIERVTLAFNKKLKFHVDFHTKDVIINVIDTDSGKVIKVLPPEELRRLHTKLKEAIGNLVNELA